jgi:cytochrome c oxidase subunit IV
MSTETHRTDTATGAHHPTSRTYVKVFLWLGVITGAEIVTPYIKMPPLVLIALLLVAMIVKFIIVAGFFMHLKFDQPKLRMPLLTGIFLAFSIYAIVLINMIMHAKYSPA